MAVRTFSKPLRPPHGGAEDEVSWLPRGRQGSPLAQAGPTSRPWRRGHARADRISTAWQSTSLRLVGGFFCRGLRQAMLSGDPTVQGGVSRDVVSGEAQPQPDRRGAPGHKLSCPEANGRA